MDTKAEASRMLDGGMERMEKGVFLDTLNGLGYQVDQTNTFNYLNGSNEITYRAKSIRIVENDSGLSFSNVDARRDDDFRELQRIRQWVFVYDHGRIWEL